MRSLIVLAAVLVVVAAKPFGDLLRNFSAGDGQYAWVHDRSYDGSHDVSLEYVRPYTAGSTGIANQQDRVKALSHVLNTGLVELSDEHFYRAYRGNLADGNYYVDASGELYYRPPGKPPGSGVQTAKK